MVELKVSGYFLEFDAIEKTTPRMTLSLSHDCLIVATCVRIHDPVVAKAMVGSRTALSGSAISLRKATPFSQHRDLNPTRKQQLETIGATVVVAQFGQMESLAGAEELARFVEALEKVAERLTSNEKRRLLLVEPTGFEGIRMDSCARRSSRRTGSGSIIAVRRIGRNTFRFQ